MAMSIAQEGIALNGLAKDDKPKENVPNGSIYVEMDTSEVYMFDAENQTWHKL